MSEYIWPPPAAIYTASCVRIYIPTYMYHLKAFLSAISCHCSSVLINGLLLMGDDNDDSKKISFSTDHF